MVYSRLGSGAGVSGTLATIGGGSYFAGAIGLGGASVLTGAAVVGGVAIAPVAVVGIFLKRNKNRRMLARAKEDNRRANKQISQIHAKCDVIIQTCNKLDLYYKIFSRLRNSARKIQHKSDKIWSEYEMVLKSEDSSKIDNAKGAVVNAVMLLATFLKNSKALLEIDVLQKAKDDIPRINDLFDVSIIKMGKSFETIEGEYVVEESKVLD